MRAEAGMCLEPVTESIVTQLSKHILACLRKRGGKG